MTALAHIATRGMGRREATAVVSADRARARAIATAQRRWPFEVARGMALFFGLFSLLNLIGQLRSPGFDQNVWWLDLRPLPATATAAILALAGLLLVWWGISGATGWRRMTTSIVACLLCVAAVRNGVTFYHVWQAGLIRPWVPFPLSFVFAAAFGFIALEAARSAPAQPSRRTPVVIILVIALCGILFPLAQQVFFGKTDYLRPAAVTVVFGTQVHGDGRPSVCLIDRVRTAAQLYKAGLTQRLLLSGGQGADEPINETAAMSTLAVGYGVPASAIEVDPHGVNTEATVRDTVPLLRARHWRAVAVVSDFFHLPRVKLAFERAGYDVTTVPSRAHRIPQTPMLVVREIPAFWVYYLRAVLR